MDSCDFALLCYRCGSQAHRILLGLRRLGLDASHWAGQVKGVGSAYWRIVGGAEAIMETAQAIGQAWMKGIGYARWLEKLS